MLFKEGKYMADYNTLYLELNKRLSILKAKLSYISVSELQMESLKETIDKLLKKLDERYSEERYMDDIEEDIIQLEKLF